MTLFLPLVKVYKLVNSLRLCLKPKKSAKQIHLKRAKVFTKFWSNFLVQQLIVKAEFVVLITFRK